MKKFRLPFILCLFFLIACTHSTQNVKSLSSFYDGVWEGYTDLPEGRFEIKMEIKNGIMTGLVENTKIKGDIQADNKFNITPFSIGGAQVALTTNSMSSDRIEGTVISVSFRDKWFVSKK